MARNKGWQTIAALVLGIAGATVFWLYGPYLPGVVQRQVDEAVKGQAARMAAGGQAAGELKAPGVPLGGFRYRLVTDGKETFLADLKEGRVWRYYRQTREGGQKEEEGFLPLPFYYGGKKYPQAGGVDDEE